jgi:parallel beta-helix repeat protein
MNKILTTAVIAFFITTPCFSQSIEVGDTISTDSTWTADTVKVTSDLTVADGATLTIQPGTFIQFQGHYKFNVFGRLLAVGSEADTIVFSPADTTTGWRGIRFDNGDQGGVNGAMDDNDSSKIVYCKIEYGRATGSDWDNRGGGILVWDFSKLLIANSLITNNYSESDGAGIHCRDSANIKIYNNIISHNTSNRYCGGLYCNEARPEIINNVIHSNLASSPSRGGGGLFMDGSSPNIINNLIYKNEAQSSTGGGLYLMNSSHPNLINNTIADNEANAAGEGIYSDATCNLNIINCIIYNNTNSISTSSNTTISYTCIEDGWSGSGTNNITDKPYFVNADTRDYHLYNGSLCLDAGENSSNPVTIDLDGENRIQNTTIDMGCYEGGEPVPTPTEQAANISFHYTNAPQMDIRWQRGNGNTNVVFMKAGTTGDASPVDNTIYTADAAFGSGSQIGTTGWYCVYNGTDSSVTVTNLSGNTDYRVMVCEYNGANGYEKYITTTSTNNPANQTTGPLVHRFYVDSAVVTNGEGDSWGTAMRYLQDALYEALPGDTIWVAKGTYYPDEGTEQTDDDENSLFAIPSGVEVYGGFSGTESNLSERDLKNNKTILSGEIQQNGDYMDNSIAVVYFLNVNDQTIFDGFTVTKGRTGIHNKSNDDLVSSPLIANCYLTGNYSDGNAGGFFNESRYGGTSNPSLINCVITGNYADGYGSGIYNYNYKGTNQPVITNCIIAGNFSEYQGAGIASVDPSQTGKPEPQVSNSIIWYNKATSGNDNVYNYTDDSRANPVFQHCNISGSGGSSNWNAEFGTDNGSNIDSIPLFVMAVDPKEAPTNEGNYRLYEGSTSIDAGTGNVYTGNTDIDGDIRIQGTAPDLGAFEGAESVTAPTLPVNNISFSDTLAPSMNVEWERGDGSFCAIFMKEGSLSMFSLTDGTTYFPNTKFGDGTEIGTTGWYCIYKGTDTTITVTGLKGDTTYQVIGFEFNGGNGTEKYLNSTGSNNPNSQYTGPNLTKFYVDSAAATNGSGNSWANAMNNLSGALQNASAGDSIWVAKGTYYPETLIDFNNDGNLTNPDEATFVVPDSVKLFGGFSGSESTLGARNINGNPTILSGDLGTVGDQSDNAWHIVYFHNTSSETSLDGFIIKDNDYQKLPAIYIYASGNSEICSPYIVNCTIKDNYSGMKIWGTDYGTANPLISSCTFINNTAEDGGAIYIHGNENGTAEPQINNCILESNTVSSFDEGGAISVRDSCNVTIEKSIFKDNKAQVGGAIYYRSDFAIQNTISNCVFIGNDATDGGWGSDGSAVYVYGPSITLNIINSTFSGNDGDDGVIYNYDSKVYFTNTILWNIDGSFQKEIDTYSQTNETNVFTNCIVKGSGGSGSNWDTELGTDKGNNLDTDPLFVIAPDLSSSPDTTGDLHLTICSPAFNNGTTDNAPSDDVEGTARDAIPDIGAYELTNTDNTNPTLTTQNTTVYLDENGAAVLQASNLVQSASDNCYVSDTTLSPDTLFCADAGSVVTVEVTVFDKAGNSASANADVTVEADTVKPVFSIMDTVIYLGTSGSVELLAGEIVDSVYDNCSIADTSISQTIFSCGDTIITSIDATITDATGNQRTKTATISVRDTIRPSLAVIRDTIYLDETGNAMLEAGDWITASDNCSLADTLLSESLFSCADTGLFHVDVTVKDISGNHNTATAEIVLLDTLPPELQYTDATVQLDASGEASITTSDIIISSTDNCQVAQDSLSKKNFTCSDLGQVEIEAIATDASGNQTIQPVTITVEDNTSPTLSLNNSYVVSLNESGQGSVDLNEIIKTAEDNCSLTDSTVSQSNFDCSYLGTVHVQVVVTDQSGNQTSNYMDISIEDHLPPVPDVSELETLRGQCSVTNIPTPTATDNCSNNVNVFTNDPLSYSSQGIFTIRWEYRDQEDNNTVQNQTVIVEDTTKPLLSCPEDRTVSANSTSGYLANGDELNAFATSDNCMQYSVANDFNNASSLNNVTLPVGNTTIKWTITDISGNESSCSFNITVEEGAVGIEDPLSEDVRIYPNPTKDKLYLEFDNPEAVLEVVVMNVLGNPLISFNQVIQKETIHMAGFKNGVYFIQIRTEKETITTKVIKK